MRQRVFGRCSAGWRLVCRPIRIRRPAIGPGEPVLFVKVETLGAEECRAKAELLLQRGASRLLGHGAVVKGRDGEFVGGESGRRMYLLRTEAVARKSRPRRTTGLMMVTPR